jgi:hypothetical protein
MMSAGNCTIYLETGTAFSLDFTAIEDGDDTLDFTGGTAEFAIRDERDPLSPVLLSLSSSGTSPGITLGNGTITLAFTAAQTTALKASKAAVMSEKIGTTTFTGKAARWDMVVSLAGGNPWRFGEGVALISQGVVA